MRQQRQRRRVRLAFSLFVACAAVLWTAKHAMATGGESRNVNLFGLPEGRAAPLGVLKIGDVARYRQVFALQRAGRFAEADRLIKGLDDRILMGHVLAERYLHPKKYRSSYEELRDWLGDHAELPQAHRIHRLALSRKPKKAKAPAEPIGAFLAGAGQELKEEMLGESFLRRWNVGIAAWRKGDYARAAEQFTKLAKDPDRQGEELAAAAFWAGRAQLRARKPQAVAGLLRKAARASDGFYGLLAQRLLDETIRFDWRREELRQDMVALLLRHPAARRAIALGQVGETGLAEGEVRKLAMNVGAQDTRALTALAAALELPSAQMRLAQQLRLVDGRRHDGAMFPIPRWQPPSGFRLDRSLIYAITRAESAFDIEAESPRGALGLMQVMPATGAIVAKGAKLAYAGPEDLMDPETNLEIGQIWLRRLMKTETVGTSLVHLIIAYNAGEARLKGWLGRELKGLRQDPLLFIESVPISETRGYVKKVLANLWAYQARLGQPAPSLQALAENRWPEIAPLDPTVVASPAPAVVAKPAAAIPVAKPRLSEWQVVAKPQVVPARRAVGTETEDQSLKRRPGQLAPPAGILGTLKIHARSR